MAREIARMRSLFNPRKQVWIEHFLLNGPIFEPLSPFAEATISLLQLNDTGRAIRREGLMRLGLYPPS